VKVSEEMKSPYKEHDGKTLNPYTDPEHHNAHCTASQRDRRTERDWL